MDRWVLRPPNPNVQWSDNDARPSSRSSVPTCIHRRCHSKWAQVSRPHNKHVPTAITQWWWDQRCHVVDPNQRFNILPSTVHRHPVVRPSSIQHTVWRRISTLTVWVRLHRVRHLADQPEHAHSHGRRRRAAVWFNRSTSRADFSRLTRSERRNGQIDFFKLKLSDECKPFRIDPSLR